MLVHTNNKWVLGVILIENKVNHYGNLCVEMYEILHENAMEDELKFYLSYAKKDSKILEPLCGSGRFLIPFMQLGFDICGVDASKEMLHKLYLKAPNAKVIESDIYEFNSKQKFDYIFIPSGSISLFTDIVYCKKILNKLKQMLSLGGKLVFAVDTILTKNLNNNEYKISASVKTKEGFDLILKNKSFYDERSHVQFYPSIYELYDGDVLLKSEYMDFRIYLYEYGEMDLYLQDIGFSEINAYSSFDKKIAINNNSEIFLYECCI